MPASDVVIVPMPGLRVDRLADGPEYTKGAEVVILYMVFTKSAEQTNGSWCGVELSELVLLDRLPITRRSRIYGS